MNQKSENPWRDLFVWAVLQNRHKMANYFWAMVSSELQLLQVKYWHISSLRDVFLLSLAAQMTDRFVSKTREVAFIAPFISAWLLPAGARGEQEQV